MMKNYLRILIAGLSLQCNALPALANFDITQGTGTHVFSFDSGTTPAGTSNCAVASTECTASVPINTAGSPLFITATPGIVAGPGVAGTPAGGVVSVQGVGSGTALPISAASLPLPTGAATSALQTTINTTLGSPFQAGGSIGNTSFAATQATASSLNATVVGTGTFAVQATIATATGWGIIADKGTFTASTSPGNLIAGEFTTGGATACATAQACAVGMTASRGLFIDISTVNAVTVLTGAGAVGTGSPRVAQGSDSTILAGSALGLTTGSPLFITPGTGAVFAQGAPNTATNGWFTKLTDGTNTAAVKAASTAPVVGDPAAVVAISPNTPAVAVKAAAASFAASAFAAGLGVDGWDLTQGTKADTVCTVPTSATACSEIALLKGIANAVNGISVGGNSAASATGSAVPANASYGGINVGGTLRGQTGVNPTGSVFAGQADIASQGGTAIAAGCVASLSGLSTTTIPATVCPWSATYVLNTLPAVGNNADAVAAAAASVSPVAGYNFVYNGSTWDRAGGNVKLGTFTSPAGRTYNTIAASQTAQVLSSTQGGGTGATGDYLSHCDVIPATTAPGVVTILDNATSIVAFPGGGTTPLSNLVPFTVPLGAVSASGGWKVTTGANVSVVCVGKFT